MALAHEFQLTVVPSLLMLVQKVQAIGPDGDLNTLKVKEAGKSKSGVGGGGGKEKSYNRIVEIGRCGQYIPSPTKLSGCFRISVIITQYSTM